MTRPILHRQAGSSGAHPSDRATRPSDQDPAGLGDTASVPCAFTPGPWLVHSTNRLIVPAPDAFKPATIRGRKVNGDDLPKSICLLRDPGDDLDEDQTLANGFLIAAAPELYEALATFVALLDKGEGSLSHELEYAMRDALAKARGDA